jgi:hypothetical protein
MESFFKQREVSLRLMSKKLSAPDPRFTLNWLLWLDQKGLAVIDPKLDLVPALPGFR